MSLDEALAAARAGLARGCGEVVLSGIDLGAWRDGAARLPELVAAVAELDGLRRVRLSSVEPRHVDARLCSNCSLTPRRAPPARAAAVGRRRRAAGHEASLHVRPLSPRGRGPAGACRGSYAQHRRDRRLPHRGRGRVRAHAGGAGERPLRARARVRVLAAAGDGGSGAAAAAGRGRQGAHGARARGRRGGRAGRAPRHASAARPRSWSRSGATASGGGTVRSTYGMRCAATHGAANWSAPSRTKSPATACGASGVGE